MKCVQRVQIEAYHPKFKCVKLKSEIKHHKKTVVAIFLTESTLKLQRLRFQKNLCYTTEIILFYFTVLMAGYRISLDICVVPQNQCYFRRANPCKCWATSKEVKIVSNKKIHVFLFPPLPSFKEKNLEIKPGYPHCLQTKTTLQTKHLEIFLENHLFKWYKNPDKFPWLEQNAWNLRTMCLFVLYQSINSSLKSIAPFNV